MWADPSVKFLRIQRNFDLSTFESLYLAHYLGLPLDRNGLDMRSVFCRQVEKSLADQRQKIDEAKATLLGVAQMEPGIKRRSIPNRNATTRTATRTVRYYDPEWLSEQFGTKLKLKATSNGFRHIANNEETGTRKALAKAASSISDTALVPSSMR
jgi:hypothetical protein